MPSYHNEFLHIIILSFGETIFENLQVRENCGPRKRHPMVVVKLQDINYWKREYHN